MKKFIKVIVAVTIFTLTFFLVKACMPTCVVVSGDSMSPTLKNGEELTLQKTKTIHLNDIVVFTDPVTHTYSVKRVIAKEGERVVIHAGWVYVNGQKLNEYYLPKHTLTVADTNSYVVEPHRVYVLGDNRQGSADSREYGTVAVKDIVGVIGP